MISASVIAAAATALRPPAMITVSEWADANRYLSSSESAIPGRWSTDVVPYCREPMDALSPTSDVSEVVLLWASQLAKTEIVLNVIGCHVATDPAPIMMALSGVGMIRRVVRNRLDRMIASSPELRASFAEPRSRDASNTLEYKDFRGGALYAVTAGSSSAMQGTPVRLILGDEVDEWGGDVGGRGDPVAQLRQRQAAQPRAKSLWTSTPGLVGASRITQMYEESDRRHWYHPCPACGAWWTAAWGDVIWHDIDRPPERAALRCPHCGALIEAADIAALNASGHWVAHEPGRARRGYYLPGWYAPWAPRAGVSVLGQIAKEFTDAAGDQSRLIAWTNQREGRAFDIGGASGIDPLGLLDRVEPSNWAEGLPTGAEILTAGVDVQDDRLECYVWAWGAAGEMWLVDYQVYYGSPADTTADGPWAALDRSRRHRYPHSGGGYLPIRAMCVDTGGHYTAEAQGWAMARHSAGVMPIRGDNKPGNARRSTPIWPAGARTKRGRSPSYVVGVDAAKATIYGRLATQTPGPGYVHLPAWVDDEIAAQLASETLRTRYSRGHAEVYWYATRARNEALDCAVYALAALAYLRSCSPPITVASERGRHRHVDAAPQTQHKERPQKAAGPKKPARASRDGWGRTRDW